MIFMSNYKETITIDLGALVTIDDERFALYFVEGVTYSYDGEVRVDLRPAGDRRDLRYRVGIDGYRLRVIY